MFSSCRRRRRRRYDDVDFLPKPSVLSARCRHRQRFTNLSTLIGLCGDRIGDNNNMIFVLGVGRLEVDVRTYLKLRAGGAERDLNFYLPISRGDNQLTPVAR